MYGRWSSPRTPGLGIPGCRVLTGCFLLWKCLQGRCLSSIHTLVPPCTRTRSTRSPLQPRQAKPSRGGLRSTAVLPVTQPPAQSSTNSTSRRQRVSTAPSLHQQRPVATLTKTETFLDPPGGSGSSGPGPPPGQPAPAAADVLGPGPHPAFHDPRAQPPVSPGVVPLGAADRLHPPAASSARLQPQPHGPRAAGRSQAAVVQQISQS